MASVASPAMAGSLSRPVISRIPGPGVSVTRRARAPGASHPVRANLLERIDSAASVQQVDAAQAAIDINKLQSLDTPAAVQLALHAMGAYMSDVDDDGMSFACSHLPLARFPDKALEVAAEQPFAPVTPLLVLNAISHLQFGTAAAAVPYQALYQRAAGAIMEAADAAGVYELSNPSLLSPQELLEYYECTARMAFPAQVYKGSGFGYLLAYNLRNTRFSPQQLVRLLEAWASLRAAQGFNPCVLNFRHLTRSLVAAAPFLSAEELLRVATACRTFEWPVYSSMEILEGVGKAALVRASCGDLSQAAGRRVVREAVQTAAAWRPALGTALEAKLGSLSLPKQPQLAGSKPRTANNAVMVPRRKAGKSGPATGLLKGLTAALPAAVVVASLAQWPPLAAISALLVVSFVAASEV